MCDIIYNETQLWPPNGDIKKQSGRIKGWLLVFGNGWVIGDGGIYVRGVGTGVWLTGKLGCYGRVRGFAGTPGYDSWYDPQTWVA